MFFIFSFSPGCRNYEAEELEDQVAEFPEELNEKEIEVEPNEEAEKSINENPIPSDDAKHHIGETVTAYGQIIETYYNENNDEGATFLDMGGLIVLIESINREKFPQAPEEYYYGKNISVTGLIVEIKDDFVPYIKVTGPEQISINEEAAEEPIEEETIIESPETANNEEEISKDLIAIPVIEHDTEVARNSEGKWEWRTLFRETGGKIGYNLKGEGYIVDIDGNRWTTEGKLKIDRGQIEVLAGREDFNDYWVRGEEFADGYAIFTWIGEDDNGNAIEFEEKVHLLP
jgi:hypothetical protein